jgi:ankyrin repeat protein
MFVKPQCIASYMLNKVVETNPEVVAIRDSDGNLPMELACMNGHAAMGGLEKLLEVGTASIGSSCQHLLVSTCCPINKAPSKKSRSWGIRKSKDSENTLFYECKEGHKESLSTVYAIFRADPAVVLNSLLANK